MYTPAAHTPAPVFDARASSEKEATIEGNVERREQRKKEKRQRQRDEKKAAEAAAEYGPHRPSHLLAITGGENVGLLKNRAFRLETAEKRLDITSYKSYMDAEGRGSP